MKRLLVCAALFSQVLLGQVPPPLELPEVVIVGQEERQIPGGTKQPPQPPMPLSGVLLDTLNPLEKHMLVGFFPLPSVPTTLQLPVEARGFLRGWIGQYATAGVQVFAQPRLDARRLVLSGYAGATGGHVRNADSVGVGGVAQARLELPWHTWFFQGGEAMLEGKTRWRRYRLFGDTAAPLRSLFGLQGEARVQSRVEVLQYQLEVGFGTWSLWQREQGMAGEQRIRIGLRSLYSTPESPAFGLESQLDLRQWEGRASVFGAASFPAVWTKPPLALRGQLGLQVARTYEGTSFLVPLLEGELLYTAAAAWRFFLQGWSRLQPGGVAEVWEQNPYAALGTMPTFPHERLGVRAGMQWMPTPLWHIEAGIRMRSISRWWSWQPDTAGFQLRPLSLDALEAHVGVLWYLAEGHHVGAEAQLGRVLSHGGRLPYYVPFWLRARYERQWQSRLASTLGIEIEGSRWGSSTETLPAYVRLWGEIRYRLTSGLHLGLVVDNALNAEILRWSGYRERGIFLGAQAQWEW